MPRPYLRLSIAASLLLGLATAAPLAAGANRFTPVGGPEGGSVLHMVAGVRGRVWAATQAAGLFRSLDWAASWQPVDGTVEGGDASGLAIDPSWAQGPILALTLDQNHPDTVFASTGDHLFRTRDSGATWTAVGLGGSIAIVAVAPSDSSFVYAVGAGLAVSRNGGDTWGTVASTRPLGFTALAVDPHDANVLYAGAQERLWRSRDGGVHWRPLTAPATLGGRTVSRLAVDPAAPHLYAGTDDGLFVSADGGVTWTLAASGPNRGSGRIADLALDPLAPGTVYAAVQRSDSVRGDEGALFKSGDGGATWTWVYQLPNVPQALAPDPASPGTLYAGTDRDGVYRTADGGTTWTLDVHGLTASHVTALTTDPLVADTLYASAQATTTNSSITGSLGIFKSGDRGASWTPINAGLPDAPRPNVVKIVADPATAGTLYAPTYEHGLYKSTDSGASWQPIAGGLPMDAVWDLAIDPKNPQNLYAVGFQRLPSPQILKNAAAKSTDGGASWTPMAGALTDQYLQAIAVDPTTPSRLYAGELAAFASSDSGANWAHIATPNANPIGQLVVAPGSGVVYAVTTNFGFYKSLDRGASWLPYDVYGYRDEVGAFQMALAPDDANTLYVTSFHGVLVSTRGGGEWAPIDPTFSRQTTALAVEPGPLGTIYVSPYYGGRVLAYTPAASSCVSDATTVCLSGRFAVRATFDFDQVGTLFKPGRPLTAEVAGFQLAGADTDLLVKIVDGRAANGAFWLFYNAFQSYYTVRVTDTSNGRFRFYSRWRGSPIGDSDLGAFPDPTPAASPAAGAPPFAEDAVGSAPAAARCVPGPTTLCLFRNRFRVEATWNGFGAPKSAAQALPLPGASFGGFTFFGSDDLQIAVRIEDHRRDFGHWWFIYSALTNLEYTLTITDTVSGRQRTYHNPYGLYATSFDSQAF